MLFGGQGNDVLAISDLNFARITGGNGFDTLRLDGTGITLDLTTLADNRLLGIEQIDITGSGVNTLKLSLLDLLNLSAESNTLLVKRDALDIVDIGTGWTATSIEQIGQLAYQVYTNGAATLKVQLPNQAPTAIVLSNVVSSIPENTSLPTRLKVADITIIDDTIGTNTLTLTGSDASFFEIDFGSLYLKANTPLDFESKTGYSITIQVDDASVGSNPDAITPFVFNVSNVNETPVSNDDYFNIDEDSSLSTGAPGVKINDSDPETAITGLSAILVSGPSHASAFAFNADGSFSYMPNSNFNGQDQFTYKVSDGANESVPATVHINISTVNDAPTLAIAIPDKTFAPVNPFLNNTASSFRISSGTFVDVDGDALAITATLANGNPLPSWLTFNTQTLTFSGMPTNSEIGTLQIKVIATDQSLSYATDTFQLSVVDTTAPTIGAIKVTSPAWATAFKAAVDPTNTDSTIDHDLRDQVGYEVPTTSLADQLKPLPWVNITQIVVSFSEDIVGLNSSTVNVFGVNKLNYKIAGGSQPQLISVTYDSVNREAILNFSGALTADKLLVSIDSDSVRDTAANRLAVLSFRLNVLPGDASGDGVVLGNDVTIVRNAQFSFVGGSTPIYVPQRDVDGSSVVLGNDVTNTRNRQFTILPTGEPTVPA